MMNEDMSTLVPADEAGSIGETSDTPVEMPEFTPAQLPLPAEMPAATIEDVVWITRRDAAARIGQSERTLRRLEQAGVVRGMRDYRGHSLYAEADVVAYAARVASTRPTPPGAVPHELVDEVEQLKGRVRELMTEIAAAHAQAATIHGQWRALAPGMVLTPEELGQIESVVGKPPTRGLIVDMCTKGVIALRAYAAEKAAAKAASHEPH